MTKLTNEEIAQLSQTLSDEFEIPPERTERAVKRFLEALGKSQATEAHGNPQSSHAEAIERTRSEKKDRSLS